MVVTVRFVAMYTTRLMSSLATRSVTTSTALVDYLPAGLESLNPELAVTEAIPEDKKQEPTATQVGSFHGLSWWLWRPVWFDHQNLRNERSEAFTSMLWGGVYNYS